MESEQPKIPIVVVVESPNVSPLNRNSKHISALPSRLQSSIIFNPNLPTSGQTTVSILIYVVTCGQSTEEADKLVESPFTGVLSKKGKNQAAAVKDVLSTQTFHMILSSNLPRAQETCKILFPKLQQIPALSSLCPPKAGVLSLKPFHILEQSILHSGCPPREYKAKGGESLEDLRRRIRETIVRLAGVTMWGREDPAIGTFGPNPVFKATLPKKSNYDYQPNPARKRSKDKISPSIPLKSVLLVTHEAWAVEFIEYVKDRMALQKELAVMQEEMERKRQRDADRAARRLPRSRSREEEHKDEQYSDEDSSKMEKKVEVPVTVPEQYSKQNCCSVTVVEMKCRWTEYCRSLPRLELNDSYLEFTFAGSDQATPSTSIYLQGIN